MTLQKIIFTVCFLSLLIVGNQQLSHDYSDNETTVTDPSVFHEEYSNYKSTMQGSESDNVFGSKRPKPLNPRRSRRPVFDDTSESTSSSDTSDLTDASETSDSDIRQRKIAKFHMKNYWQKMRAKILSEFDIANHSTEDLFAKLRKEKYELMNAWLELKNRTRNGSEILDELMSRMKYLNTSHHTHELRNNSELENETTVTDPSVFHEEFSYHNTTIQGSEDNRLFGTKAPKLLDYNISSSDSSDLTDSSDSNFFGRASQKARDFKGKKFNEIHRQRKVAQAQVKRQWQALKEKILREAEAANRSTEEVKAQLRNAKREFKNAWEDLKLKPRRKSLNDLMSNMEDLKPDSFGRPTRRPKFQMSDTSSSDSSDFDFKNDTFKRVSQKAKDIEEKTLSEIRKQKMIAKLQARKYWQALKSKIMKEANATNASTEELQENLRSARKDVKQKWRDLKWKIKNGNDVLDELMENMNDLNKTDYFKRGSTEPVIENDTATYFESKLINM